MFLSFTSRRYLFLALLCGVVGFAAGCGTAPNGQNGGSDEVTIKRVAADALPDHADYLPPLDDGRIEIPGPKDWQRLPREVKYLARYVKESKLGLPRILVTVDASDFEGLETVNEENIKE